MVMYSMNPSGWCVEDLGLLTLVVTCVCTYVHPLLSLIYIGGWAQLVL